jgi:hypothetical protein
MPPSYDSLYNKVKNASQSIRESMQSAPLTSLRQSSSPSKFRGDFCIKLLTSNLFHH